MLEKEFEALNQLNWGTDRKPLNPIDDAVIAAHGDAKASKELEDQFIAALKSGKLNRDGVDFVCRKLMIIGTAAAVPALAELLPSKENSHMARFALERIPAAEAAKALRDSLSKVESPQKIGVISSLGQRRDKDSASALAGLVNDADSGVARAAALALGEIKTAEAAKALTGAKAKDGPAMLAAADANLTCAEWLLANGNKAEALAIYKTLTGEALPKHIRLAGTRGMLACAGKKD